MLLVEDEHVLRDSLEALLEDEGYLVSTAENGREALAHLRSAPIPDIILLDLRMPIMDGWEFRTLQKDDPELWHIPVVAISADGSAQAAAISAQAYLRKPLGPDELLRTIERILFESERRQMSARLEESQRLASLGRLAAGVGHEINNPLTVALMSLHQCLQELRSTSPAPSGRRAEITAAAQPPPGPEVDRAASEEETGRLAHEELDAMRSRLGVIQEMLEDCQQGLERIRDTVANLQRLSRAHDDEIESFDVREIVRRALSSTWNQLRHRATVRQDLSRVPLMHGNSRALEQAFVNLLINAVQALPETGSEHNEIAVSTDVRQDEIVVEIRDTGKGIFPEAQARIFEPYFTTQPAGSGSGLGLSISRQTVLDHRGRIEVDSQPGKGTTFRIFLPGEGPSIARSVDAPMVGSRPAAGATTTSAEAAAAREGSGPPEAFSPAEAAVVVASAEASQSITTDSAPVPSGSAVPFDPRGEPVGGSRGRILVVDDEPLIGRIIQTALVRHDVVVCARASEAIDWLATGRSFDLVLCDVVMPELSGPDFYQVISERWPELIERVVFMTGGAFTPGTEDFMARVPNLVLPKPFKLDRLRALVAERMATIRADSGA